MFVFAAAPPLSPHPPNSGGPGLPRPRPRATLAGGRLKVGQAFLPALPAEKRATIRARFPRALPSRVRPSDAMDCALRASILVLIQHLENLVKGKMPLPQSCIQAVSEPTLRPTARPGGAPESSRGPVPACRDAAPGQNVQNRTCAPAGALDAARDGPYRRPCRGATGRGNRDPGAPSACGGLAPGYFPPRLPGCSPKSTESVMKRLVGRDPARVR